MIANQINKLNLEFLMQMRVLVKVKEPLGIHGVMLNERRWAQFWTADTNKTFVSHLRG
jgi:hypothetical protein